VWGGIPAYFSDFKLIDAIGYSDHYIARLKSPRVLTFASARDYQPGHMKWDWEYVLSKHPDLVFQTWGHDDENLEALLKGHGYRAWRDYWVLGGSPWFRGSQPRGDEGRDEHPAGRTTQSRPDPKEPALIRLLLMGHEQLQLGRVVTRGQLSPTSRAQEYVIRAEAPEAIDERARLAGDHPGVVVYEMSVVGAKQPVVCGLRAIVREGVVEDDCWGQAGDPGWNHEERRLAVERAVDGGSDIPANLRQCDEHSKGSQRRTVGAQQVAGEPAAQSIRSDGARGSEQTHHVDVEPGRAAGGEPGDRNAAGD
jgi:hypothetical protein